MPLDYIWERYYIGILSYYIRRDFMNIILNKSIEVIKNNEKLIIKNTKIGKEYHFKNSDLLENILIKSVEEIELNHLLDYIYKNYKLEEKETFDIIKLLMDKNILVEYKYSFSNTQHIKYSRQIEYWESLFNVDNGIKIQEGISKMNIVIVGTGGIGTWISLFLAQLGVSNLTLIDDDKVEISNIPRQVLFDETDIGEYKVSVLKEKLMKINRNMEIKIIKEKFIENKLIFDKIPDISLVINCADFPTVAETSKWINSYCYPKGIPFLVGGGYSFHSSKIGTLIIPDQTPCWNCYISSTEKEFYVKNNEESIIVSPKERYKGTINISCVFTAAIQTLDIIKYISGVGKTYTHSMTADLNLENFELHYHYFKKQHTCNYCGIEEGNLNVEKL